ncbi:hypothetical protein LT493_11660 [Streptomyces tricolor]|nr:hypothetical protein [Streptomyces tricolor]
MVEAVGSAATYASAFEVVRDGGTVVGFGRLPVRPTIPLDLNAVHYRRIRFVGSYHYAPGVFEEAARLLETGQIDLKSLLTHRIPLDRTRTRWRQPAAPYCLVPGRRTLKGPILAMTARVYCSPSQDVRELPPRGTAGTLRRRPARAHPGVPGQHRHRTQLLPRPVRTALALGLLGPLPLRTRLQRSRRGRRHRPHGRPPPAGRPRGAPPLAPEHAVVSEGSRVPGTGRDQR